MEKYAIGDGCLCWSFSPCLEEITVRRTVALYKSLKSMDLKRWGIHDIVPSYKSIALHFDPAEMTDKKESALDHLMSKEWALLRDSQPELTGKEVVLPVDYSGEDLDLVATHCGLTREEVVRIHSSGQYLVAMVGFKPHFPYLIGLDSRLEKPRLDSPRTRIPAGAVAIGGAQTGVYPQESPGGWNIIGMTDPELLKQVVPGDTIIFKRMG
jgi:KipI family sensor histidine kinase inhibitor